jgi:hypothetical protein
MKWENAKTTQKRADNRDYTGDNACPRAVKDEAVMNNIANMGAG